MAQHGCTVVSLIHSTIKHEHLCIFLSNLFTTLNKQLREKCVPHIQGVYGGTEITFKDWTEKLTASEHLYVLIHPHDEHDISEEFERIEELCLHLPHLTHSTQSAHWKSLAQVLELHAKLTIEQAVLTFLVNALQRPWLYALRTADTYVSTKVLSFSLCTDNCEPCATRLLQKASKRSSNVVIQPDSDRKHDVRKTHFPHSRAVALDPSLSVDPSANTIQKQLGERKKRSEHARKVCSWTEWDPLEEIIVGTVLGATTPPQEPAFEACFDPDAQIRWGWHESPVRNWWLRQQAARNQDPMQPRYTRGMFHARTQTEDDIAVAEECVENFIRVLKGENIIVRRPDEHLIDFDCEVITPDFYCENQSNCACPRDLLLVLGDEIIEATMSLRSRFFEYRVYRPLMWEYFNNGGCKWTTAPKPLLADELYRQGYPIKGSAEREAAAARHEYITNEYEPIFDAADVLRCGRDLFVQHSQTTNMFGMRWLQRHVGTNQRVHPVHFPADPAPVHIDATFVVPRPGLCIANPDRPMSEIGFFEEQGWRVLDAPTTDNKLTYGSCSHWISMNCLSIDENTICVEAAEKATIRFFQSLGFRVLEIPFAACYEFGGSLHCYTQDIRRRGGLQSYFSPSLETFTTSLRPWTPELSEADMDSYFTDYPFEAEGAFPWLHKDSITD